MIPIKHSLRSLPHLVDTFRTGRFFVSSGKTPSLSNTVRKNVVISITSLTVLRMTILPLTAILLLVIGRPAQTQEKVIQDKPVPSSTSPATPSAGEIKNQTNADKNNDKSWEKLLPSAAPRSITITVGTYQQRPFVFWEDEQTYGYSIDLWQDVASAMDVKTTFVQYENVTELLKAVNSKEVDIGISGISITPAREGGDFDFSYPIYHSGLQLMIRRKRVNPLITIAQDLGGWQSALAVSRILGLSIVAGGLIWFLEHKKNEDFPTKIIPGIGQGIWFAVVTLGTFGYGDITPKTVSGRLVAVVWMAFSFFVLGDFISTMTAARQERIEGTTLVDLQGERIGAVLNTSAYFYLRNEPVQLKDFPTFQNAVKSLREGNLEGIVADYPTVKYLTLENKEFVLTGNLLNHESYGIITRDGNEILMEAIDREVLKLERSGRIDQLRLNWFGDENS